MPRKRKTDVKVNNTNSLEELLQETYNDACLQITESQKFINELASGVVATTTDIDDLTKIAKEKGGLLKVKDSAIKLKLEIAKLQSDIIKNSGDVNAALSQRGNGSASTTDFKAIRDMLKENNSENESD